MEEPQKKPSFFQHDAIFWYFLVGAELNNKYWTK